MEPPTKSFPTRWASNCSRRRAEGNDSLRSAAACTVTAPPSAGRCFALRSETSSRSPPRLRLPSKGGLMEELDFSKPAREPVRAPAYDPAVALEFFRSAGKHEEVPAGTRIFSENEKASRFFLQSDKMYYLLEGEVTLVAKGKPVRTVTPGQIFGEWAAVSEAPRSATAIAGTACRVIALDDKALRSALAKKPEFAIMLLSMMISRLRGAVVERLGPGGVFGEMALIDQTTRAADAAAETDCELLAINRIVLLNLVKADPTFAVSLLSAVAERVRNMAASLN